MRISNMKLKVFLCTALCVVSLPSIVFASTNTLDLKSTNEDFKTEYKINDGWHFENEKWYYYQNNTMQKGWISEGYDKYYMDPSTGVMQTGWLLDGSDWYYLSPSTGLMQTGWTYDGYDWYYIRRASGVMQTGWIRLGFDSNWYYLNPSGAMQTGWLENENHWYYLNPSGIMQTNTVIDDWNIWENGIATKSDKFYTGIHVKEDLKEQGFEDTNGELAFFDPQYGLGKVAKFEIGTENVDMIFTVCNDLEKFSNQIRRFCDSLIWEEGELLYSAISNRTNQTLKIGGRTVIISVENSQIQVIISPVTK